MCKSLFHKDTKRRLELILHSSSCLKDGEIAEVGNHSELIAKDGEYAKLYNIQANAFLGDLYPPSQSDHKKAPASPRTDDSDDEDDEDEDGDDLSDDSYDSSE